VPSALTEFGFTIDPGLDLIIRASFEGKWDGDDYIEGNGGDDVIFGNRGQDDLLGGSSDLFGLELPAQRPDGSDLLFGGAGTDVERNDIGDAIGGRTPQLPIGVANDLIITLAGGHAHDADVMIGDNGVILRLVGINGAQRMEDGNGGDVWSTGGFLNFNYDVNGPAAGGYGDDGVAATYDRIIVRSVEFLDYHEGGNDYNPSATGDRGLGDEMHGESGDDLIHGMTGPDVLYGEGQDDDLVGGYGNDWISGGTGADGVIGDDGRIVVSRNATGYGEPLHGVARLLRDNNDTRTFNGNMMNEVIATPGSIQQAVVNVGGDLKKAVNLTPFSFDPDFNGQLDEFTAGTPKKRGATPDNPFPHNADDIIFGGLGGDWLHGGSGDDAISGGEALAEGWTQMYDETGVLIGITRSDYGRPYNPVDALRYNPIDANGWHHDRTRRSGEFALYDEYDPMRKITLNDDGTADVSDAGGKAWFLNFATEEGVYVPAGINPKPAGQQAANYAQAWDDGADRIFGDTGNDWLVGGTGRDDLFGGFGNDLLNADDDHGTDQLRNELPDTQVSYEDRAFGGAGRDVLIGNTGGDRLIDWVGEFNSFLVPFAPFGMATVSRTLQPQLAEFLYTLSASDGADPTRWADTNGDPLQKFRNGEPEGELGVIRQKDFAWQDQTGAPSDPQAGIFRAGTGTSCEAPASTMERCRGLPPTAGSGR
jgi:Ca2+-binding RTX toxin-like protein